MIHKASTSSRTEAWIHGLPSSPQVTGAPFVMLSMTPFEPRDRRITVVMETTPALSGILRDLERSRQSLSHLVIAVRDGRLPKPDTTYEMSGVRVESITPRELGALTLGCSVDKVTFAFETVEVVSGINLN